jgi:hypothetical protein
MGPPKNAEPVKRYNRGPLQTQPGPHDHETPAVKRSQMQKTEMELPLPEARGPALGAKSGRLERPPTLQPKESLAPMSMGTRPIKKIGRPIWDRPYKGRDRYPIQDQECDYSTNAGPTQAAGVAGMGQQAMRQEMVGASGAEALPMHTTEQKYRMVGANMQHGGTRIGTMNSGTEMFTADNLQGMSAPSMPEAGHALVGNNDQHPELVPIIEPQAMNRSQRASASGNIPNDPWLARKIEDASKEERKQNPGAPQQMGGQMQTGQTFANMYQNADPTYQQEAPVATGMPQQPQPLNQQQMFAHAQQAGYQDARAQQNYGGQHMMPASQGRAMDSMVAPDMRQEASHAHQTGVAAHNVHPGQHIPQGWNPHQQMAGPQAIQGGLQGGPSALHPGQHLPQGPDTGTGPAAAPLAVHNQGAQSIPQYQHAQMLQGQHTAQENAMNPVAAPGALPFGADQQHAAEFMNVHGPDEQARPVNAAGATQMMHGNAGPQAGTHNTGVYSQRADMQHALPNAVGGQAQQYIGQVPVNPTRTHGTEENYSRIQGAQGSHAGHMPQQMMPEQQAPMRNQSFEQRASARANDMSQDAAHMPPPSDVSLQMTQEARGTSRGADNLGLQVMPSRNDGQAMPAGSEKGSMAQTIREMFVDEFGDSDFASAPKPSFQQQMTRASNLQAMPDHRA